MQESETRYHLPNIATRGMMVNVSVRWASAIFATPVNATTGSTPKSTAPFSHTLDSACAAPPQLGREVGPNLPQQQSVHSVNRTLCQSLCLVPVRGVVSLAFIGNSSCNFIFSTSCTPPPSFLFLVIFVPPLGKGITR